MIMSFEFNIELSYYISNKLYFMENAEMKSFVSLESA